MILCELRLHHDCRVFVTRGCRVFVTGGCRVLVTGGCRVFVAGGCSIISDSDGANYPWYNSDTGVSVYYVAPFI